MASPTNCISYNVGLWPLGGIVVPRCDHRRCAFSVLYAQRSGYVHHVITRMDHSVWNHVLMYRPLKKPIPLRGLFHVHDFSLRALTVTLFYMQVRLWTQML